MTETKPRPPPGALLLLGYLCEAEEDPKRAVQYYYLAVSTNQTDKPAVEALKRLGKLH
jgi:hypothetical protein